MQQHYYREENIYFFLLIEEPIFMYKSIVTKKLIVDWKLRASIKNSEKGIFLEKNQGWLISPNFTRF